MTQFVKEKTTIYDIAMHTGLSTATVHRALMGKKGVSAKTAKRVQQAAEAFNYRPNSLARRLSGAPVKLAVVCSDLPEFFDDVRAGAERAFEELKDYNVEGRCLYLNLNDEAQASAALFRLLDEGYAGIALPPPPMLCGLIDRLVQRGACIATYADDVACSRRFCVRSDCVSAGRLAGELLYLMLGQDSEVAVFTCSRDMIGHGEKLEGFRHACQSFGLRMSAVFENYDDPEIAYRTADLFVRTHPNVRGLYIASANATTVLKRLEEMGMTGRLRVVASDLFPQLKHYFETRLLGATIFQDPYSIARKCVHRMYRSIAEGAQYEDTYMTQPAVVLGGNFEKFMARSQNALGARNSEESGGESDEQV